MTEETKDQVTLEDEFAQTMLCGLTTVERLERMDEFNNLYEKLTVVEAEEAEAKELFKNKKKGLEGALTELRTVLREKKEYRDVACQWEYNWTTGIKQLIRLDTMEVCHEMDIQDHERQKDIPVAEEDEEPQEEETEVAI